MNNGYLSGSDQDFRLRIEYEKAVTKGRVFDLLNIQPNIEHIFESRRLEKTAGDIQPRPAVLSLVRRDMHTSPQMTPEGMLSRLHITQVVCKVHDAGKIRIRKLDTALMGEMK